MSPYTTAWLVAGAAGLLGVISLIVLTRHFSNRWLRRVCRWLPPLLLLVPAEVPGFDGNYAPAFVVLIFEALFQVDGEPMEAARMLIVAGLTVLVAITLASRSKRGVRSRRSSDAAGATEPE